MSARVRFASRASKLLVIVIVAVTLILPVLAAATR